MLLILVLAFAGWKVYGSNKSSSDKRPSSQNEETIPASNETSETPAEKVTEKEPITEVPSSLIENIAASINTMNTAALEGYMASEVNVVFAATEKGGPVSPTTAISDLNYISSATPPWNFSLSSSVLDSYKNGYYGQYFGDLTVVGLSSDNYVVSFGINGEAKIDSIFIAANANLLQ